MNPLEWPWWAQFIVGWSACAVFVLAAFAVEIAHNKECVEFCAQGGDANAFHHRHEGLSIALLGVGLAAFLLGIFGALIK